MGRATRWLKSLLTGKKENSRRSQEDNPTYFPPEKEKKRWSFTKSSNADRSRAAPAINAAWIRSVEREQSKHAIAVAAATAAAADAAVAAAQAAVAVVRLTRHGVGSDRLAAVKIQTAFRGFLAKKALRALKALVKLQALVRGYLVRKQAAATLHSMQALIRAQAAVRMQRLRPRRSVEEARSEHTGSFHSRRLSNTMDASFNDESPKIVEVDPGRPRSWGRRSDSEEAHSSPLARLSVPLPQEPEWCLTGDECRFSTAQSTPRLMCYPGLLPSGLPVTPAKSTCGGRQHGYMAYTKSSIAKTRSQSAPKQRPEPKGRRMTLTEIMEARASLSGPRMQRTCSRAQEAVSFKNTIMGRFDRSSELKENLNYYEKDYCNSQRKW